jgi:hypothetical protein
MADPIKTGGPAFPVNTTNEGGAGACYAAPGMDLRDFFAAKALQGLMTRSWADPVTGDVPDDLMDVWARSAYMAADAMLKVRGAA